jgi:hypothetical protein
MSEFNQDQNPGLSEEQRTLLDSFCESERPKTSEELAIVDQAASEMRDTLQRMGLVIETEEQFHTACIISIATAVNMRKLSEMGAPIAIAEQVTMKTIAALRPDSMR